MNMHALNRHAIAGLAIALQFLSGLAVAQNDDSTRVVVATQTSIHSNVLGQHRKIYIYTPSLSSFTKFDGLALPVLYLTDGDALASVVAAQVNYLSTAYGILPPMIIVGINNYSYDRTHDLTPVYAEFEKTSGGGDQFLQFIKEEVIPYVEGHYKTEPFRILVGHSYGGLFALNTLITSPDLFDAYIAISPSLWWNEKYELKEINQNLSKLNSKNKFLFTSDANESLSFHSDLLTLDSLLKKGNTPGLRYMYHFYPEETHGSEPVKAIYDGLRFLFPQWYPPPTDTVASMVQKHYQQLSLRYGYSILPNENLVNRLGNTILKTKPLRIDDAIDFFKLNIKNYPKSFKAYEFLGDAFVKKGNAKSALANYQQALALMPSNAEIEKKLRSIQAAK